MPQAKSYTHLIEKEEVLSIPISGLRILDCRADLFDENYGVNAHLKEHIDGSDFISVEQHLSGTPGKSGRHPLPKINEWVETIRDFGIHHSDQIVLYDDAGGCYATRAWWMFRWAGHEKVAVLNGGWDSWDGPKSSLIKPRALKSKFRKKNPLTKLVTLKELKEHKFYQLVDARTVDRWSGRNEPIDHTAGHIPGAFCLPFIDNLDEEKKFKPRHLLASRFRNLNSSVVCYCGSGITATHNIMAIKLAGLPEPYLYVGSWSEWIEHEENPIEQN